MTGHRATGTKNQCKYLGPYYKSELKPKADYSEKLKW